MWFHNYLSLRGYTTSIKPRLQTRIKQNNKVFYQYRVASYTFASFNWIHEMFYHKVEDKFVKKVSSDIENYLTPLALAIWFMDDGSLLAPGVKIAVNNFTFKDIMLLCRVIKVKYQIIASIHSGGKNKGYTLYIHKQSMKTFSNLVKPFMLKSMLYKLGNYK